MIEHPNSFDPVESLLVDYLARVDDKEDGESALEDIVAAHPEHEDELRLRVAMIDDYGIAGESPASADDSDSPLPHQRLGDFDLIERLGEGGMGEVWEAEQRSLGRRVALKLVRDTASMGALLRFRREAQAVAKLSHPHVAALYGSGEDEGRPWISMELIPGRGLDEINREAKESETDIHELSRWGFEVGQALAAAHEVGVIHRDIKPSNIRIRPDGAAVLLDFGLARIEAGPAISVSGSFAGSPAYAAPEQIDGNEIGPHTDVYGLGATLYHCLVGTPPHVATSTEALFQKILSETPAPPRRLDAKVHPDLDCIVQKCMEKRPSDRYASAAELTEDLGRFLSHRPILARPPSLSGRLVRWRRRNPVLAGAAAIVVALAFVALIVLRIQSSRHIDELETKNRRLAEEKERADEGIKEWERLADGRRFDQLIRLAEDELWPAIPERIPQMEAWIPKMEALLERLEEHRGALDALRQRALPKGKSDRSKEVLIRADRERDVTEAAQQLQIAQQRENMVQHNIDQFVAHRDSVLETAPDSEDLITLAADIEQIRLALEDVQTHLITPRKARLEELRRFAVSEERLSWTFADAGDQLRHDQLMTLLSGLEQHESGAAEAIIAMRERIAQAREAQRRLQEDDREAWAFVLADVERKESPYAGLELEPIAGLVPLGRDSLSGFWEFWHVSSGSRPTWQAEGERGRVVLDDSSGEEGLVLVLIPGGSFTMGSRLPDDDHSIGDPNVDPKSWENEGPPIALEVEAFLISKFEVTQGQWARLFHEHPSYYSVGDLRGSHRITLRNPVTDIDAMAAAKACRIWDLDICAEANWEYACRAETSSPYSTGQDVASLAGYANIADEGSHQFFHPAWPHTAGFADGHGVHARIAGFLPNPFGLFDMHGNVQEICRATTDEERQGAAPSAVVNKIDREFMLRGGSFNGLATSARSASRLFTTRTAIDADTGFRPMRSLR